MPHHSILALAYRLGSERIAYASGAQLAVASRRLDELTAHFPAPHRAAACDVSREEDCKALAAELKREGFALDGAVLAAGSQTVTPLMMESNASLSGAWDVNKPKDIAGPVGFCCRPPLVASPAPLHVDGGFNSH
jgi:NAD(P)-dependent dehydrogenase (short-subunit alcohol dehydrogenase family)